MPFLLHPIQVSIGLIFLPAGGFDHFWIVTPLALISILAASTVSEIKTRFCFGRRWSAILVITTVTILPWVEIHAGLVASLDLVTASATSTASFLPASSARVERHYEIIDGALLMQLPQAA